ncbi:MAG: hypothetical protein IJB88_01360 [Clostridia bacterium]|nr:hypothetical protein [Clostridia bacterium]
MNKEATYSSALTSENDWFVYRGLEEVKILDIPETAEKLPSNDDYDVIQFNFEISTSYTAPSGWTPPPPFECSS